MSGEGHEQMEREEELGRGGDVRLVVPAAPEYLRLVRLTAAGLASRLGFTFDEVEDLRIAVDELCFHLLGGVGDRNGGGRTMDLTYSADTDSITITGRTGLTGPVPDTSCSSTSASRICSDSSEGSGTPPESPVRPVISMKSWPAE